MLVSCSPSIRLYVCRVINEVIFVKHIEETGGEHILKMKRRWLLMMLFIKLLLLIDTASAAFPRFPTADDYTVAVGGSLNPYEDDITDDEVTTPIEITHMRVRSEIALRYARTAIISNVYNPSRKPQEATFNVLLPETAFISGFTMILGKETYEAFVKEKEVAKKIYTDAVKQGVAAAHVATKARDSNHFTIRFNVEGRSNATYRLRYEEFLVRRNGVYNHAINLHPGALVPKMDVVIHIKESQKISKLRVPELRTGNEIDATEKDAQNSKAIIKRGISEREATVIFTPDLAEQKRLSEIYSKKSSQSSNIYAGNIGYESAEEENANEGLLGQFVVQYDVEQPKEGEILVNDGYFVHFFAPSSLPPLSKHAVFVLDTSGSMWGTKLEQMKKAMDAILSDLHPNDYFSIIEFNSEVMVHDLKEADRSHKQKYDGRNVVPLAIASPQNIAAAKVIVSRFKALGGTNIFSALEVAIDIVQKGTNDTPLQDCKREENIRCTYDLEPVIIFLTDGEATVGQTDLDRIITQLSEKNTGQKQAPLFSLAFGEDADRVFLRMLSLRNEGFMRHIYEAADAALQLHDFYRQVSSPLLSNVKFLYPSKQIKEGSLSRTQFRTINDGSEVAVVGKVAEDATELTPELRALRSDGGGRGRKLHEVKPKVPVTRQKDNHLPLERLWAYLTIKQLLEKRDAYDLSTSKDTDSGDSPESKALAIALKYSFVTPLTSLVVVRLNKTELVDTVDPEKVDEPQFLPYSVRSPSKQYTTLTTSSGFTLNSKDGPVLLVQSSKRFAFTGYGRYPGGSHGGTWGGGSHRGTGDGGSHAGKWGGGSHGGKWGGGYHGSGYGGRWGSGSHGGKWGGGSHSGKWGGGSNGGGGGGGGGGYPSTEYPDWPSTTKAYVTTNRPLDEHDMGAFGWTSGLRQGHKDALVFEENGSEVILKLSSFRPQMQVGGDRECSNSTLPSTAGAAGAGEAAKVSAEAGSVCVYLTRCPAARTLTVDDYKKSYCIINDGYAGVCCPRNEVDV